VASDDRMMHREQLPRASTRGNDEFRPFIELMYSTGWNTAGYQYPGGTIVRDQL